MTLLVPGRHHLLTNFQASYLFRFCNGGMAGESDFDGKPLDGRIDRVVFAVTSSDHSATRRNPFPFFMRAMALHELGKELGIPLLVYGIPEAGARPDFAEYTVKSVFHESEGLVALSPDSTIVACATGVADLYRNAGYRVWRAERSAAAALPLPWEILERIANTSSWRQDPLLLREMHPSSYRIIERYGLDRMLTRIMSDPLLGADGDITATRDYGSYVRQMDQNIEQKWLDTETFVRPGRIGDIGCAVGSWIVKASHDKRFVNSDFYGIEITMALHDICVQRRHNGEFGTPNVWFGQKNAVESTVFKPSSMTTIHTSSLTHEIESYAGRAALHRFIANRFSELESGGVWINRDVIGPECPEQKVILALSLEDGITPSGEELTARRAALKGQSTALADWLSTLSSYARLCVFAMDFRHGEGYCFQWEDSGCLEVSSGIRSRSVRLSLGDAMEFLSKKDYTDNWESEMHETFCYWSFSRWKTELEGEGFTVSEKSHAVTNPWIVQNRWLGKVSLFDEGGKPLQWPPTNAIIIGEKE